LPYLLLFVLSGKGISVAELLLNALASTAGGGITYLRNVLPRLGLWGKAHRFTVLVPPEHLANYQAYQSPNVTIVSASGSSGLLSRLWWEQTQLRAMLTRQKFGALVSLGNFALLRSPVPQLLFSRNELYFSAHFEADLKRRRAQKMLRGHQLKSYLARLSLQSADWHAVPSAAMAEHLQAAGVPAARLRVLPFGFDAEIFKGQSAPLDESFASRLADKGETVRLLYVSHYNYFRNFETLLRALPLIQEQLGRRVELVLTADIQRGGNHGGYDSTFAATLIEHLGIADNLIMLGAVPYEQLHAVYQACDLFVCPSYAESFGHPLLEAMALRVPVVAANLPIHREICQTGALYFDVFDERQLAAQAVNVLTHKDVQRDLVCAGEARVQAFSWDAHVRGLVKLIETMLTEKG
jgi:glycosyltransferase involved in cell wall biosynthesis